MSNKGKKKAEKKKTRPVTRDLIGTDLMRLQPRYESGDKAALLRALTLCISWRRALPEWARQAAYSALKRYNRYEAATLDEAFGVLRRTDPRIIAAKCKERELAQRVCIYILAQSHLGRSRNEDFFEETGERFGIPKTTVKEYWRLLKGEGVPTKKRPKALKK